MRIQEPRIHDSESPGGEPAALRDFPLHSGTRELPLASPLASPTPADEAPRSGATAPLSARWAAAAADAALVLLMTALAILAARSITGRTPALPGIAWAAAYIVLLSFFSIVPALVLFGRTVGMALADLSVRSDSGAAGIDAAEAARRWLATIATGLTAGVPLIFTASDSQAPTPADRFSGRALIVD